MSTTKVSNQTVYYISSKVFTASGVLDCVRRHWQIEALHFILDERWGEDRCTARKGDAYENITLLRKFAYNLTILAECKGMISKKEGNPSIQLFAKPATVKQLLFGKSPACLLRRQQYNLISRGFERGPAAVSALDFTSLDPQQQTQGKISSGHEPPSSLEFWVCNLPSFHFHAIAVASF